MSEKPTCVAFLKGNLTEGFTAYGPYVDVDGTSRDCDMYEGWIMTMTMPGHAVRIAFADECNRSRTVGHIYLPDDVWPEQAKEWLMARYTAWRDDNPDDGLEEDAGFIDWLCNYHGVRQCPPILDFTLNV